MADITYDFEDGTSDGWTLQNEMQVKSNVARGSYSIGAENGSANKDLAYIVPYSTGKSIYQLEFYWQETSSSNGGGLDILDTSGNSIARICTSNPDVEIQDSGTDRLKILETGNYNVWYYFKYTFHWDTGTYDLYAEDTSTGESTTLTGRGMLNNTNFSKLYIHNATFFSSSNVWNGGEPFYMWWDDFAITENAPGAAQPNIFFPFPF